MMLRASARIGIVEAIAALTLLACGSAPAAPAAAAPNCSEWSWAFQTRGSDSLRLPLAAKTLTVTSLRLHPGQFPTDEGICDDHATSLTWDSSDPAVASVTPIALPRSAAVLALSPGTTTITVRFLVDGAPISLSILITVLPALTPFAIP